MKKLAVIAISMVLVFSVLVSAGMLIPANQKAIDHSPVIGENGDLMRVDFIHYAKPTQSAKPSKTDTCYKLLGVKWNTLPVNYVINPTNSEGLSQDFVVSKIVASAETWDDATSKELLINNPTISSAFSFGVQDYKNTIDFGPYYNNQGLPDESVIAVTSIWFSKVRKQIIEFDMRFNDIYAWGDATSNTDLMDLQNIATHEFGHAVGLGDLYTSTCTSVTMYGYSYEGDILKRSLEQPDITGLQKMYGF